MTEPIILEPAPPATRDGFRKNLSSISRFLAGADRRAQSRGNAGLQVYSSPPHERNPRLTRSRKNFFVSDPGYVSHPESSATRSVPCLRPPAGLRCRGSASTATVHFIGEGSGG